MRIYRTLRSIVASRFSAKPWLRMPLTLKLFLVVLVFWTSPCCLIFSLEAEAIPATSAPEVEAPENPGPKIAKVRTLGLGLFFPIAGEELDALEAQIPSLEDCSALAFKSGEGGLSSTIPLILSRVLEPLPSREAKGSQVPGVEERQSIFKRKSGDEALFDIRTDSEAILDLDAYVLGFYADRGKGLDCLLLYFEKDQSRAVNSAAGSLGSMELEKIPLLFLPRILSWVKGMPLSVYDIEVTAPPALLLPSGDFKPDFWDIEGSRIFALGSGLAKVTLRVPGYEIKDIEISNNEIYIYRKINPGLAKLPPSTESVIPGQFAQTLEWKEESAFIKADSRFRSALGRFILSLPISFLATGQFLSTQEAYSRSARPAWAFYASGGFAGVSLGLSLGLAVDSILALVDKMRLSR